MSPLRLFLSLRDSPPPLLLPSCHPLAAPPCCRLCRCLAALLPPSHHPLAAFPTLTAPTCHSDISIANGKAQWPCNTIQTHCKELGLGCPRWGQKLWREIFPINLCFACCSPPSSVSTPPLSLSLTTPHLDPSLSTLSLHLSHSLFPSLPVPSIGRLGSMIQNNIYVLEQFS